MKVGPSGVWSLIRQTFEEWSEDKAPQLGVYCPSSSRG